MVINTEKSVINHKGCRFLVYIYKYINYLNFLCLQSMCIDDEYKVAHRVYSLDYRPIEGNVTDEGNSFIAPNFKPHGKCQ
jgi:hypothetical protein